MQRASAEQKERPTRSPLQVALLVLKAPFILLQAVMMLIWLLLISPVIGPLLLLSEVSRRRRAWRLKRAMTKLRRRSSWADVEAILQRGASGTLITDGPFPGWNDTDLWWTHERVAFVAAREGIELPNEDGDFVSRLENGAFDQWCESRYFDAAVGTAALVQCTHSWRQARRVRNRIKSLQADYPKLEHIEASTFVANHAAALKRRAKPNDEA